MSEIPRENNPDDVPTKPHPKSIEDYINEGKVKTRIIQIVCSGCGVSLGEKEVPDEGLAISHGICEACRDKIRRGEDLPLGYADQEEK